LKKGSKCQNNCGRVLLIDMVDDPECQCLLPYRWGLGNLFSKLLKLFGIMPVPNCGCGRRQGTVNQWGWMLSAAFRKAASRCLKIFSDFFRNLIDKSYLLAKFTKVVAKRRKDLMDHSALQDRRAAR